jgi:Cysteine rich repeat
MVQRVIFGVGRSRTFSRPSVIVVRSVLAAACLIGTLALLLSRVSAQDTRSEARQACKADYSRLCSGISPGGGRVRKCLNDNFDALSEPCKQAVSARAGR